MSACFALRLCVDWNSVSHALSSARTFACSAGLWCVCLEEEEGGLVEFEKRRREDLFVESAVSDGESPFLLVLVDELVVGVSPQLVLRLKRRLFSSGPEEKELDEDICVCVWEDEGSLLLFLCDPSHGVASAATTARGSAPRSFGFNSMFPKELLYSCGILLFL